VSNSAHTSSPQHLPSTPSRRAYKTKIASVAPVRMRHQYELQPGGYLGISLENEHFTPPKLEAMIRWLNRRFKNTAVLIGDSIHRITLETVRGMPAREAHTTAMQLGQETVDLIRGFDGLELPKVLRCSEIQASRDFRRLYQELTELFERDVAFRASVTRFSETFQQRNDRPGAGVDYEWRVRRSCDYFLEEFAVFACLVADGYGVMAYPGAFSTLSEIVDGRHPDVPAQLRSLVVVSLDLRGRDREPQQRSV